MSRVINFPPESSHGINSVLFLFQLEINHELLETGRKKLKSSSFAAFDLEHGMSLKLLMLKWKNGFSNVSLESSCRNMKTIKGLPQIPTKICFGSQHKHVSQVIPNYFQS